MQRTTLDRMGNTRRQQQLFSTPFWFSIVCCICRPLMSASVHFPTNISGNNLSSKSKRKQLTMSTLKAHRSARNPQAKRIETANYEVRCNIKHVPEIGLKKRASIGPFRRGDGYGHSSSLHTRIPHKHCRIVVDGSEQVTVKCMRACVLFIFYFHNFEPISLRRFVRFSRRLLFLIAGRRSRVKKKKKKEKKRKI